MRMTEAHKTLLDIASSALFHLHQAAFADEAVYEEAIEQAVFPLIVSEQIECPDNWKKTYNALMASNFNISYEHTELHELMTEHQIPYVVLKGVASASYYPTPILRTFGDVDFLVKESDMEAAGKLLESIGFIPEKDRDGIHIGYHREESTWELHRSINGIPEGKEMIAEYLSDIIETAVPYEEGNGTVMVPDPFHHGLVLLLHTASHLTSEGIGLRHLCDWAVFAASLTNDAFAALFEEKLKNCGLWRFAQLLTLVSVKYLGAPERQWAGTASESMLETMMQDILTGGNFGHKDNDRYRQIKYISNRGERTVDEKSTMMQLWDTIGKKAKSEGKSRLVVVGEYAAMVLSGKRKLDSRETMKRAADRKQLYAEFHLFEQHGN